MEEIGRQLRKTREAQGITLEAAEEETRIRRKYLQAIEAGDQAEIPGGDAYLKGFIRSYGNYLGLDGPALVEAYKQTKEELLAERARSTRLESAREARGARNGAPRVKSPEDVAAAAMSEQPARAAKPEAVRPEAVRPIQPAARPAIKAGGRAIDRRAIRPDRSVVARRRAVAAVLIVLLLGGAGGYAYWRWLRPTTPAPSGTQSSAAGESASGGGSPGTAQPSPAPGGQTPPVPQPQPAPPKVTVQQTGTEEYTYTVPAKEITVVLEYGPQRVWMSAVVDGKEVYQGDAKERTAEFKGANIRLRMGHMLDTNLVVNGQRFEKPLGKGPYWLVFQPQA